MLISTLRNIGIAELGNKSEIDIILEEQWSQLKRTVKQIINCKVNLETGNFELETVDFDEKKVPLYLPGITPGHSKNYSPFTRLKLTPPKKVEFPAMNPNDLINFKKFYDYRIFEGELSDELPIRFGKWLEENKGELANAVHKYLVADYLKKDSKGRLTVVKGAPNCLGFSLIISGQEKKIGEIESFRELYILQKEKSEKSSGEAVEGLVCIACGKVKPNLKSLQNCKFFELFSLDQLYFKFNFRDDTPQAMICNDCENLVRVAYNLLNDVLKFEAYNIKVSEKERKYVLHSILPLTDDPEKIRTFINELRKYRKEYYDDQKRSITNKLMRLQESLERADKKMKKELKNKLKKLEKQKKELEQKGLIKATMDMDYITVLEEAKKRKLGLMDFYYTEEMTVGQTKKVVVDVIYGDKQRIEKIVNWIITTSKEFNDRYYRFQLKKLISCFGEKAGRYIFQSLFTGKKLREEDLYRNAYKKLWPTFKSHVNKNNPNDYSDINIIRDGIKTLHFTLALLERADLIRR